MTLSIRARLTVWYAAVVVVAFAAGTVVIAQVQARVALNRLDDELTRLQHTVAAVIHNEFGEGLDLAGAVKEASVEVAAEARTIVVTDPAGRVVGSWGDALPNEWSSRAPGFRRIQVPVQDSGHAFVVTVLAPLDPLARERGELLRALAIGTLVALIVAIAGGWLAGRHAIEPAALDAQRQFMADASHQLRTPVSIIRTTAQVTLAKDRRSETEYRESTAIVAEQSARLTRLVDGMFLLARGDAGGRALRTEVIYLDELLGECVRGLGVISADRQVRLESTGDVDVQLVADQELLRQMLFNLLENAIRHTPPGGAVRTTIHVEDDRVDIAVQDEGPGIAPADRERIFQRFVSLHPGSDGAGLGLPLARWIAEAHRGSLMLDASGPGGSRFRVRLPRR